MGVPELSRFELQCLGKLWSLGTASIRNVHEALDDAPTYSTVKKIFERLEEKGAVERVRRDGKAWVYRSVVRPRTMIRKELRRRSRWPVRGRSGRRFRFRAQRPTGRWRRRSESSRTGQ